MVASGTVLISIHLIIGELGHFLKAISHKPLAFPFLKTIFMFFEKGKFQISSEGSIKDSY